MKNQTCPLWSPELRKWYNAGQAGVGMCDSRKGEPGRPKTDEWPPRILGHVITGVLLVVLLSVIAARHSGGSAPPAMSWTQFMIFLTMALMLAAGAALSKYLSAVRTLYFMILVGLILVPLRLPWPSQVFLAVAVATALVVILLAACLVSKSLRSVNRVRSFVELWHNNSWPLPIVLLAVGIIEGCEKLSKASAWYSEPVLILSFLVFVVAIWAYRHQWLPSERS